MSKITYENKEQLNTNENIPAKNKCMASDLNEIKSIVNENDTNALYNTNVKTTKTDSDTDVYSCNYLNKFDGVILYEDETGINTTVNLKESVANYKYIDIFFRDDNNIYDTKRFLVKNGAWYTLQITQYNEDSSNVIIRGKNIQLNADKIYNGKYCAVLLSASGNTLYWNNNIYICKVIGYK